MSSGRIAALLIAVPAILSVMSAMPARADSATLSVAHDMEQARPGEVITIAFAEVLRVLPGAQMYHLVVRDSQGRVLRSQVTNYEHDHRGARYDDLVFQYDFAAGEKRANFTLETVDAGTPPDPACVYARVVPERFGDMAWENDRIAHRMYSATLNTPAAAGERLRGSGIDVWGKRVTYPIVDRWYAKGHDQFHRDGEGEGFDLYSVGGSRGAGGTGIWDGTKLWTSDNFTNAQVLTNGPLRAVFRLSYASWDAGASGAVRENKQFTVECGHNLDQIVSEFEFDGEAALVGIGITAHPQAKDFPAGVLTRDPDRRWMSWWEENNDGGLGVAVILFPDADAAGFAYEAAGHGGRQCQSPAARTHQQRTAVAISRWCRLESQRAIRHSSGVGAICEGLRHARARAIDHQTGACTMILARMTPVLGLALAVLASQALADSHFTDWPAGTRTAGSRQARGGTVYPHAASGHALPRRCR